MKSYDKAIKKAYKTLDEYINGLFGECSDSEFDQEAQNEIGNITEVFAHLVCLLAMLYGKTEERVSSDISEYAKEFKRQLFESEEKVDHIFFLLC